MQLYTVHVYWKIFSNCEFLKFLLFSHLPLPLFLRKLMSIPLPVTGTSSPWRSANTWRMPVRHKLGTCTCTYCTYCTCMCASLSLAACIVYSGGMFLLLTARKEKLMDSVLGFSVCISCYYLQSTFPFYETLHVPVSFFPSCATHVHILVYYISFQLAQWQLQFSPKF